MYFCLFSTDSVHELVQLRQFLGNPFVSSECQRIHWWCNSTKQKHQVICPGDEHQPCHLQIEDTNICITKCTEEYGNPCERFCPAQVYNIITDENSGAKRMQVDFSNCVHCKTCDIRDPYQIIKWVPPEGGDGPEYDFM